MPRVADCDRKATIALADYIFGPQHAFIAGALLESTLPAFTAHAAAKLVGSNRTDLVEFILHDLVRCRLLLVSGTVFRFSGIAVHKTVQRLPDAHLLRQASGKKRARDPDGEGG